MSAVTDTIRNGVDTEQLFATLDLDQGPAGAGASSSSAPATAGSTARTTARRSRTSTRAGEEDTTRSEAFAIDAGEPAILLGTDTGANPAEYLLHALAACLTTSIVYVAAARKVQLTSVESTLDGRHGRARRARRSTTSPATGSSASACRSGSRATRPRRSCARSSSARRQRSAVYDMVTNGVPVAVDVTTD